ncbi:MAG: hypothetical protein WAM69_16080, partial [Candidatus Sulfotelmatobacter sp.]
MALLDGRRPSRPKALVRNSSLVQACRLTFVRIRGITIRPFLWLLSLALTVACGLAMPALGQTDVNDVHIVPRELEKAKT